jgi:hypothetical protein
MFHFNESTHLYRCRGLHIFQKSRRHLKILGARKLTLSNNHIDEGHTSCAIQVARDLCSPVLLLQAFAGGLNFQNFRLGPLSISVLDPCLRRSAHMEGICRCGYRSVSDLRTFTTPRLPFDGVAQVAEFDVHRDV